MSRLEKLRQRRIDPNVTTAKLLQEVYASIGQSEAVKYVIGAMQPIDPEYTKNTYSEGERICNQLKSRLSNVCDFAYQGSVTNDTHIKAKSDLDILLLTGKFWSVEPPLKATSPYQGDPVQDLIDLRNEAIKHLQAAFPKATVDASGSKSIAMEGGSLQRKIDVVPANWCNTVDYENTNDDTYRAVKILDSHNKKRIKNTPFLHNALIDTRDTVTSGNLRKAARLLKSLKYDTDSVDLSSYDLVAIAYSISPQLLTLAKDHDLAILQVCIDQCHELRNNSALRDSVMAPDGHRTIFESPRIF